MPPGEDADPELEAACALGGGGRTGPSWPRAGGTWWLPRWPGGAFPTG